MILDGLFDDLHLIGLSVITTLLIVGIAASAALTGKDRVASLFPILFGLAMIGTVAGVAGGTSRTGVVGDIVPAALALIGTVSIYVFGAQKDTEREPLVAFAAAAFALSLGLGYAVGAANRAQADAYHRSLTQCTDVFANPAVLSDDMAFWRAAQVWGNMCMEVLGTEHARTADARGTKAWDNSRALLIQRLKYNLALAETDALQRTAQPGATGDP